jgi:hypothetical protein
MKQSVNPHARKNSIQAIGRIAAMGLIAIIAACSTPGPAVEKPAGLVLEGKSFLVAEPAFCERAFPAWPLLDAGAFRSEAAKIIPAIAAAEIAEAPSLRETIAAALSGRFKGGATLGPDPLQGAAQADFTRYDRISRADSEKIAFLLGEVSADFLVLSAFRSSSAKVGTLGRTGSTRIEMGIYLFDREGKLAAKGSAETGYLPTPPADLEAYKKLFALIPETLRELLAEF